MGVLQSFLKEKATTPPHDCQLLRFNTINMLESSSRQGSYRIVVPPLRTHYEGCFLFWLILQDFTALSEWKS